MVVKGFLHLVQELRLWQGSFHLRKLGSLCIRRCTSSQETGITFWVACYMRDPGQITHTPALVSPVYEEMGFMLAKVTSQVSLKKM